MKVVFDIFIISAPLLFAILAALCSNYAGVLAVFLEGIISLSGFFFIYFTIFFNNSVLGFFIGLIFILSLIFIFAVFTEKTHANPFLVGLSINFFSHGIITHMLNGLAVLSLPKVLRVGIQNKTSFFLACLAFIFTGSMYLFLRYTRVGLHLQYVDSAAEVLRARGVNLSRYRIGAWLLAAFFAFFAGVSLAVRLFACTAYLSGGRGWIALAAVFIVQKKPLLSIPVAVLFLFAEYVTYILQGMNVVPGMIILSLPYILALILVVIGQIIRKKREVIQYQ